MNKMNSNDVRSLNYNQANRRLNLIRGQLFPNVCINQGRVPPKSDDDVVIIDAVRTPLTKSGKGGFKDTMPEILITGVLNGLIDRTKVDPKLVEDICFGNVLSTGAGFFPSRMSQFLANFSEKTSLYSVNRLCSSGLQAVMNIAYSIASKQIDIGIGGGFESMSVYDMNSLVDAEKIPDVVFECQKAANCMIPMGITSENVAKEFNVDRKTQDNFAYLSQKKAKSAQDNGLFDSEIISIKTKVKNKKGEEEDIVVSKDDGIRATTVEGLAKLKPSFKKDGTTTAGNSSQTTDGAAAVLLMRRSVAKKLGLTPTARILGYAVAGVPPEVMGIGPAFAIPEVLKRTGLKIDDIDIFELNEAFASQATYCANKLKIPIEKINPKGGAIALGHPLGCTGARQFATLLPELKRQNKKYGLLSMCIGTGMGAAAVIERE